MGTPVTTVTKTLEYKVPNEKYGTSDSDGNTCTATYVGPDQVWVFVDEDGDSKGKRNRTMTELTTRDDGADVPLPEGCVRAKLDASKTPDLLILCITAPTGATIISDLDNSPKSILFWRAIMQWLGGIGIVVMAITILPLLKVGGMQLFKMEGPDSTEKILPRTIEVATIIISTYIILTILCGFFYWCFGMSIFDSVSHAMTTIATGGFSTHNDSIGFFKSSNIEIVASVFIILGSIPFISYLRFSQGNRKVFFQDVRPARWEFPDEMGVQRVQFS